MRGIEEQKLLRIIDANFNRAKEALRVCEDICRFVLDQKTITKRYKDVRHQLTDSIGALKIKRLIVARNIEEDVGKATTASELKRKNVVDVFYANSQRAKESVRVLEEMVKLVKPGKSVDLKDIRYTIYALEKKIIKTF
ncbi:MAG: thiamine-phosphate pyrophosphorylase [Candidatus Omnitrophica bacterium]|nr:thiamine-phosphate pyrophosphorylase [Candidatus Omnitrophota bacterium]